MTNNHPNQSSDAVNQCGKDPVAMALEALENLINEHDAVVRRLGSFIDGHRILSGIGDELTPAREVLAYLSSIKDQQAQPVEYNACGLTDGVTARNVALYQNEDGYVFACLCSHQNRWSKRISEIVQITPIAAPVDQQAHGAMPVSLHKRYEEMRQRCLKQGNVHPDSPDVCHIAIKPYARGLEFHLAALLDDMYLALTRCDTKETAQEQGRDITDTDILDWIIDNYTGDGGGNGFEVKVWVPVDSEDLRDGISQVIRQLKEPHHGK